MSAENARRLSVTKQKRMAALRARKAGAGLTFTGSVVDELEATNFALEREVQDQVYSNQVAQGNYRQRADMAIWEGKVRAAGTRSNANADLLMSGARMGSQLFDAQQEGVFN